MPGSCAQASGNAAEVVGALACAASLSPPPHAVNAMTTAAEQDMPTVDLDSFILSPIVNKCPRKTQYFLIA
jgi:hypothetical protein